MNASPAQSDEIVNAMTIDVEDYFHVSVFDGLVPRDQWNALDSRVCSNTERLLDIFADTGVTATFFVLGCVAERFPTLVTRIASLGHAGICSGQRRSHRGGPESNHHGSAVDLFVRKPRRGRSLQPAARSDSAIRARRVHPAPADA